MLLVGCGGGGGGNSTAVSSPPQTSINISGSWSGAWTDTANGNTGALAVTLTQSLGNINGSLTATNTIAGTISGGLSGTVNGNTINFGVASGGGQNIQFSGTINSGTSLTGMYTSPSLGNGRWQLVKNQSSIATTLGLVAYYPLDGNPNDASGNGNGGIANGALNYMQGRNGQAASFDGITSFISTNFLSNYVDVTFSAWINPTRVDIPQVIVGSTADMGSGLNGYSLQVRRVGVNAWFDIGENATSISASSSTALAVGVWQKLTGVKSGSTLSLYLDGVLVGSSTTTAIANSNRTLTIGKAAFLNSGAFYFSGLIDDVRIYNRALTVAEIQAL